MRHLPRTNLTRRATPRQISVSLRVPLISVVLPCFSFCSQSAFSLFCLYASTKSVYRNLPVFAVVQRNCVDLVVRFVLPLCVFKKFSAEGRATHFSIVDIVKTAVGLCSFFKRFSDLLVFPNRQRSETSFNTRNINDWKSPNEIYICKSKVIETSRNITK